MHLKQSLIIIVIAVLVLGAYWFFVERNNVAPSRHDGSLPIGYTFDRYEIAEKQSIACKEDGDCSLPMEYAIRSSCPFASICIKGTCTVVCPGHQ